MNSIDDYDEKIRIAKEREDHSEVNRLEKEKQKQINLIRVAWGRR